MKACVFLVVALCTGVFSSGSALAQGWPQVFEPTQVLSLNLSMTPEDWQTIQDDATFAVRVPAQFWAAGESPILVAVRRKSATALQNGTPFKKVSLKIDINELVPGQRWRGLNKLSLENGDDSDVVTEGLAWQLNRLASGPEGYDYQHPAALAAWVRLDINGVYTGVYVSVEQRDRRFLVNRGLFVQDQTWLFKVGDINQVALEVGTGASPAMQQLCYSPFEPFEGVSCPVPPSATMISHLDELVDMRSMLALGAVERFINNRDGLFSHGKNFFFADFASGRKRMYFPWDLDAAMAGNAPGFYWTRGFYGTILTIPQYRAQYSRIMNDLLCGPFQEASLHALVNALEPVLAPHLEADPNNRLGGQSTSQFFASRRAWFSNRINTVRSQIEGYIPCPPPPQPCYANCDQSTVAPVLNVDDFTCFINEFASAQGLPHQQQVSHYANCDGSTVAPALNVDDFTCFINAFAEGCR
jgi:hypothetical protein